MSLAFGHPHRGNLNNWGVEAKLDNFSRAKCNNMSGEPSWQFPRRYVSHHAAKHNAEKPSNKQPWGQGRRRGIKLLPTSRIKGRLYLLKGPHTRCK